ncbi:DUF7093 family protein [Halostagnicola bangensis]
MVLRCSLLGHSYGEPEVDREREERGSEVVLTVTEFQACQRCGERNIITENTEVTSIVPDETPARASNAPDDSDQAPDPARSTPPEPSTEQATGIEPDSSGIVDAERDAEPLDAEAAVSAEQMPAEAASDDGADEIDVPTDENDEPIVDDGEILEDDGDDDDPISGDRRHGEWPDSADVGPPVGSDTEPSAWPDDEQERAQAVADDEDVGDRPSELEEQPEDDAVILESGSETTADSSGKQFDHSVDASGEPAAEPGSDPEPADGSETSAVQVESVTEPAAGSRSSGPETGITSAESAPAPGESSLPDGATTEFFCPQCRFVAPGDSGSLRTGDICPECKKGYIGERTA